MPMMSPDRNHFFEIWFCIRTCCPIFNGLKCFARLLYYVSAATCRFDKAASHLSNLFFQSSLKYFSLAGMIERSGAPYKISDGDNPRALGVLTHSIRPLLNSSQSRLPFSAVLATRCFYFFIFYFYLHIYPPDSQESDGGAIHRVSNYPDLLPEMPRYCCPLVI